MKRLAIALLAVACRQTLPHPPTCQEAYLRSDALCGCMAGPLEYDPDRCDTQCLSSAWIEYTECAAHEPTSI